MGFYLELSNILLSYLWKCENLLLLVCTYTFATQAFNNPVACNRIAVSGERENCFNILHVAKLCHHLCTTIVQQKDQNLNSEGIVLTLLLGWCRPFV